MDKPDTKSSLKKKIGQQEIVSRLGEIALSGAPLNKLMNYAVNEVSKILNLPLVRILKLLPSEKKFVLRAGVGWKKKYKTGQSKIYLNNKTHAGYTRLFKNPIIAKNLKRERRFRGCSVLADHNVVLGMSVIIQGSDKPFGILSAHALEPRDFTKDDINFIQSVANIIGLSLQRRETERFLNLSQERFEHAQKAGNIGVFDWDMLNDRLWWSDEEAQLFGFKLGYSPYPSSSFMKNVHPDDRKRVIDEASEIFQSGQIGTLRFRWINKRGDVIWIESHVFVIKDDKGKQIGIRGVNIDITERMEIERRKDEFISMASHELKTPLTTIKVFSHLLAKDLKNGNQKTDLYLSKIEDQVHKLENLVNDLLDISKIQTGRMDIRKEKFSIRNLIDKTVDEMKLITGENIILGKVENETVYADKERLSQVLINLLSNAIKYSPTHTPVKVRAIKDTDKMTVSVKDRGFGISKEHQQRIFDRFYRVYDNLDRTFPGLGMGLYISNEIIRRHDGKMWFRSQIGKGSTFYFSLPLPPKN